VRPRRKPCETKLIPNARTLQRWSAGILGELEVVVRNLQHHLLGDWVVHPFRQNADLRLAGSPVFCIVDADRHTGPYCRQATIPTIIPRVRCYMRRLVGPALSNNEGVCRRGADSGIRASALGLLSPRPIAGVVRRSDVISKGRIGPSGVPTLRGVAHPDRCCPHMLWLSRERNCRRLSRQRN
jgi:hypothetical protein